MITGTFLKNFTALALVFMLFGFSALWFNQTLLIAVPFIILFTPLLLFVCIYKTDWLYYALLALLPLSTEINFTEALGMDVPDEILMMLLTGLFIVKVIHQPEAFPRNVMAHPLSWLLVLLVVWLAVACVYSMDAWLSIKFILAKSWFIVPFVILPSMLFTSKKSFKRLGLLLLIPMLFVVLQTLARHAYYNFSFEGIKNILSPFFRNHVNYAAMLVCLLAVATTMNALTPKENKYRLWLQLGLLAGFIAIVLAYSRGAWVALIAGAIGVWLIKKRLTRWMIGAGIVCLFAIITLLMNNNRFLRFANDYNTTIFHQDIADHLAATVQLKDVSNAERFYRWSAAVNMIAEKPATGFGPNNFYQYYKPYAMSPFKTWVSNNPEHSSVHNYFLLTALEQGLPGLLFFCLLFFGMIVYSEKLYHALNDRFYKLIALCIGVVLIMIGCLIFMSDLIETDKIGSLFWLSLGLLIVLGEKLSMEKKQMAGK